MIKHIKCDILKANADVICHQVNCQGVMGSGVAKQIKDAYPEVFEKYSNFCSYFKGDDTEKMLGMVVPVMVDNNTKLICNLFSQNKYGYDGSLYTSYDAIEKCLKYIKVNIADSNVIAIPYLMGCYRGGGDWNIVYKLIEKILGDREVLICEYNGK